MTHSGSFLTPASADEVFDLLATPERFAPLLPDFESMLLQDPTHFILRIVVAVGQINGHANLAMGLREAVRPGLVGYCGQGIVAGSQLHLRLQFQIVPSNGMTEVNWQGEFSLDGGLAFMAGNLIELMGRKNFDRMAERLCDCLRPVESPTDAPPGPAPTSK